MMRNSRFDQVLSSFRPASSALHLPIRRAVLLAGGLLLALRFEGGSSAFAQQKEQLRIQARAASEPGAQTTAADRLYAEGKTLSAQRTREGSRRAAEKFDEAATLYLAEGNRTGAARSLNDAGFVWSGLGDKPRALAYFERALPLRRDAKDQYGEAVTLNNMGLVLDDMGDKRKAIAHYEQALPIFRALNDRRGEATTLNNIGAVWSSLGDNRKALEIYEQLLPLRREVGDRRGAAITLNNIGKALSALGDKRKALDVYEQALSLIRAENDRSGEATMLNNIGAAWSALGEKRKALGYYDQALLILRETGDRRGEAWTLNLIGVALANLGERRRAMGYYEEALPIYRAVIDRNGEAMTLNNLGTILSALGEKRKALEYFNQVLPVVRDLENRYGEANTLNNIGIIWSDLGDKRKSLEFYEPARQLFHQINDRKGEALTLHNIGAAWAALGEKRKAIEYYDLALPLTRAVEDRFGEAATLNNIGIIWSELGEKRKALASYEGTLKITRAVGDKAGESKTLGNIGFVWADLGEQRKALIHYEKSLSLARELEDKRGEAATLTNIARTWFALGEIQTARDLYEQAQRLYRGLEDRAGEALTLHGLAHVWSSLGEKRKALELYEQSLSLRRRFGDRKGEAEAINNIGHVWADLGEHRKSREYFEQALPLWRAVGDRKGEATTLNNLMQSSKLQRQPRLAAFWGKQAISRLQGLRLNIQALDVTAQQSFQRENEYTYSGLADILLSEKRYAEAHQILTLGKDQEFYDLAGLSAAGAQHLELTPREAEAQRLLESAYVRAASAGQKLIQLQAGLSGREASAEDSATLKQAQVESVEEGARFQAALRQIEEQFNASSDLENRRVNAKDLTEMQDALRELRQRTGTKAVAIYTLVGLEQCRTLLITPEKVRSAEASVSYSVLNEKSLRLLRLLQNPKRDPRPLAKEVYDLLFKPIEIEVDADQLKPSLIMWSLDRSLRYLPMGALYDGQRYLAERYQHVVFTRTNKQPMLADVSRTWTGIGFGSSGSHTINDGDRQIPFGALPGVARELDRVFGNPVARRSGVLQGQVWLDGKFTKQALFSALKQQKPLVHIASHFSFRPGDDGASFLLLGSGETLSMAEMKEQTGLFGGVELLNLSACNTAAQLPGAFGREVDGFAELAQRLGAKAVMATLWEAWDETTPGLMEEFYRSRQAGNGLTKAAALQKAQLGLLQGQGASAAAIARRGDRSSERLPGPDNDKDAPPYKIDPKAPHSHPYYWAPFILIGNWR